MTPVVATTVDEWQRWRENHPGTLAFVPTMGALHPGHIALVRRAREIAEIVVVSIFVNPKQFGPAEDFDRYPRTLDADLSALEGLADLVFAPTSDEVYPADHPVEPVSAGPVGETFEGVSRPGHFDGMLTVVNRLFDIVNPDVAVFGEKDAQQVFLVRTLAARRGRPVIEVVPTQREEGGLALSSRNRYLSSDEHEAATVLSRALAAVRDRAGDGAVVARASGESVVASEPLARLDYLELVDPETFISVPDDFHGETIAVVAARLGSTRLIDTARLTIS